MPTLNFIHFSGAIPVCTLALTMLDFYLQWIEGLGSGAFSIRHADWMMAYGQEKTPRLTAQVYSLTTCIKRDVEAGLYNLTFQDWSQQWYDSYRDRVSPTTYEGYGYTLKLPQAGLGPRKLSAIKPIDIENFLKELQAQGKSGSYLSKFRTMLFQIFHKAEANDLIRKNPVRFADKPRIGPPETASSLRDIPVPQSVRPSVLFLRSQAGQFLWDSGVPGQPFDPAHFRRNFQTAVSAAGVRPLTPHSCRHTYVSQLQALGVDMETIQSMVGHADIEMTQHYLHVQEKVRQAAARKLSKSLGPSR